MRRAVITGAGAVSAFGAGLPALHDALAAGRDAVGPIRSFDASTFPARVAGEVPGVDASARADRDRKIGFALAAAAEAWNAARCGEPERAAGLSVALGLEEAFLDDFAGALGPAGFDLGGGAGVRFRSRLDRGADALRHRFALRGPVAVHVSACAAGALAVAHAASWIERGAAEVVLCGAADSMLNPLGIGGMARLNATSPRHEPDACRPFDRRRDGLAIGEGAAMFVVESEARARARGVPALARVLGWGSSQDAYKATAPRPDGAQARRAMERALRRARLAPADVGYVNAHGTGTPLNDVAEARAIQALLGPDVPVSSIKGAVGHLMAAAGAIELAACLLPFARDLLPGTAHHRERDPECAIDVIGPEPRAARVDVVLSNSFGFGGQNATVILGRA